MTVLSCSLSRTRKDVTSSRRRSTRYAWVLTQFAAASPAEFSAINALQDQLKLTPLGAWGGSYTPPADVPVDPTIDVTATPYDQLRLITGEEFFLHKAAGRGWRSISTAVSILSRCMGF